MKYYSRSPEELRQRFEEQCQREKAKNRSVRLFFVLNILLVVFVLGILQYRLRMEESQKKNYELRWSIYTLRGLCYERKCLVKIEKNPEGSDVGIHPRYLALRHYSQEESRQTLFMLEPNIVGNYETTISLEKQDVVFAYLLDEMQKEVTSFRIYP
ncbi:MAG: hypothetical protein NZM25_10795 [Leptospiraceae bacterium]|nr:hypothetical protein [Leptospiraceae bacterium]